MFGVQCCVSRGPRTDLFQSKIQNLLSLRPPTTRAFFPTPPNALRRLPIWKYFAIPTISNNFPCHPLAIAPADRQAFAAQGPRAPPLPAHLNPGAGPQRGHCRRPRPRRLHRRVRRSLWCLWSRILYFLSVTLQSRPAPLGDWNATGVRQSPCHQAARPPAGSKRLLSFFPWRMSSVRAGFFTIYLSLCN